MFFLGLEFDQYSEVELNGYDYLIGSLHYLKIGNEYVGFDRSAEVVSQVIDTYFDGNGMAFAKEYYRQLSKLPESKEYLKYAIGTIEALRGKIPFFEVNTGAIARGYRTTPYPYKNLIKIFKEMGFGAIITSDCHNAEYLDCAFEDARKLLLECGFREQYILTDSGFKSVELKV